MLAIKKPSVIFVTKKIQNERLKICENCEYKGIKISIVNIDICEKCKCNLNEKTKFKKSKCPIDKWGPVRD